MCDGRTIQQKNEEYVQNFKQTQQNQLWLARNEPSNNMQKKVTKTTKIA